MRAAYAPCPIRSALERPVQSIPHMFPAHVPPHMCAPANSTSLYSATPAHQSHAAAAVDTAHTDSVTPTLSPPSSGCCCAAPKKPRAPPAPCPHHRSAARSPDLSACSLPPAHAPAPQAQPPSAPPTLAPPSRLASLIPPPRFPLQRLSGVFGPRSPLRAAVVPRGPARAGATATLPRAKKKKRIAKTPDDASPFVVASRLRKSRASDPTSQLSEHPVHEPDRIIG
jgi:hypothetical protein